MLTNKVLQLLGLKYNVQSKSAVKKVVVSYGKSASIYIAHMGTFTYNNLPASSKVLKDQLFLAGRCEPNILWGVTKNRFAVSAKV
jgi:hypothetical protein